MNNLQVNASATDITETILHFIDIYIKEHPQDYSQTKFTNCSRVNFPLLTWFSITGTNV